MTFTVHNQQYLLWERNGSQIMTFDGKCYGAHNEIKWNEEKRKSSYNSFFISLTLPLVLCFFRRNGSNCVHLEVTETFCISFCRIWHLNYVIQSMKSVCVLASHKRGENILYELCEQLGNIIALIQTIHNNNNQKHK